jgi:hypothetical protein
VVKGYSKYINIRLLANPTSQYDPARFPQIGEVSSQRRTVTFIVSRNLCNLPIQTIVTAPLNISTYQLEPESRDDPLPPRQPYIPVSALY